MSRSYSLTDHFISNEFHISCVPYFFSFHLLINLFQRQFTKYLNLLQISNQWKDVVGDILFPEVECNYPEFLLDIYSFLSIAKWLIFMLSGM